MARRLTPVGLDFVESAPLRLVFAREVAAPPGAVYEALAEDVEGWPRWFGAVTFARSTQDGTGREVRLRGGACLHETVLVAQPDERYAYRVDQTNTPGMRALVEEWRIAPTTGGSRVQWTFAAEGAGVFRFGLRFGRAGFGRAFRDAVGTLERQLTSAEADA